MLDVLPAAECSQSRNPPGVVGHVIPQAQTLLGVIWPPQRAAGEQLPRHVSRLLQPVSFSAMGGSFGRAREVQRSAIGPGQPAGMLVASVDSPPAGGGQQHWYPHTHGGQLGSSQQHGNGLSLISGHLLGFSWFVVWCAAADPNRVVPQRFPDDRLRAAWSTPVLTLGL